MTIQSLSTLVALIEEALAQPDQRREHVLAIRKFVESITETCAQSDIARDLAWDLSFYEPDEMQRKEDPSFFGDDRLVEELRVALERLTTDACDGANGRP